MVEVTAAFGYGSRMLVGLLGCIDYGVNSPPPDPAPEVDVTPTSIDVPMVCGTAVQQIWIANTGTGNLTITSLDLEGDGWSLDPVDLPIAVAPDESYALDLHVVDGDATLTIGMDDADEPTITVPLSAHVNTPPTALISSPWEEQFIGMEEEITLSAVVGDDETAAEELTGTWTDSLTGLVATVTPDADGHISTPWPAADRAPGPQVMYLTLEDPCAASGGQSVFFCQDGPFPVEPLVADAWIRHGDVSLDADAGVLTFGPGVAAGIDGSGIYDPDEVDVTFTVSGAGAGFSLTALDSERRDLWVGGDGCGLGFGDCDGGTPLPGWSLAFDLEDGDGNDCGTAPSVGLTFDGDQLAYAACAALPVGLGDGAAHDVNVHVASGIVTVTVDAQAVELPVTIDSFAAYLGFTAADGDFVFSDVVFTDYTCDCETACDN